MRQKRGALKLGLLIVAMSPVLSRNGQARTVITPLGEADDSCVHAIPKGGSIDVQTGDVVLKGAVVGHHDSCTVSSAPLRVPQQPDASAASGATVASGAPGGIGTSWFDWSWANATHISGTPAFDSMYASWTVPADPFSQDGTFFYFFPSLQNNAAGCAAGHNTIIQPVLQWGAAPQYGGHYWTIAAWEYYDCDTSCNNCSLGYSPPETVSAGDTIQGSIWQWRSDAWRIEAQDLTNGAWTYNDLYNIPSSWPRFNTAQGGVFEAYNLVSYTCSELSPTNVVTFNLEVLTEAGPSWNSFVDVMSGTHAVSWSPNFQNPSSPDCGWFTFVQPTYTSLYWNSKKSP